MFYGKNSAFSEGKLMFFVKKLVFLRKLRFYRKKLVFLRKIAVLSGKKKARFPKENLGFIIKKARFPKEN